MLNLLRETLGIIEDIVTLPTDLLGITRFSDKKAARTAVELLFSLGEINQKERDGLIAAIGNESTLNI